MENVSCVQKTLSHCCVGTGCLRIITCILAQRYVIQVQFASSENVILHSDVAKNIRCIRNKSQQYLDLLTGILYLFNNFMICFLDLALRINLISSVVDIVFSSFLYVYEPTKENRIFGEQKNEKN